MKDSYDEIWEALLKTAVIENSYNEIKDYPLPDEIDNIQLPIQYDKKMWSLLNRYARKKKLKAALRYTWKTAVVSFSILGIAFLIFMQFDEVRAACQNVITYIYEEFLQFDIMPSEGSKSSLEVGYIPEGFILEDMEVDENGTYLLYKNDFNSIIEIACFVNNRTFYMDNEQYSVSDIEINNVKGYLFESKVFGFDNYITWSTDKGYFYICSTLDKNILSKIAKSIK